MSAIVLPITLYASRGFETIWHKCGAQDLDPRVKVTIRGQMPKENFVRPITLSVIKGY
jgi:hypothetical protein